MKTFEFIINLEKISTVSKINSSNCFYRTFSVSSFLYVSYFFVENLTIQGFLCTRLLLSFNVMQVNSFAVVSCQSQCFFFLPIAMCSLLCTHCYVLAIKRYFFCYLFYSKQASNGSPKWLVMWFDLPSG